MDGASSQQEEGKTSPRAANLNAAWQAVGPAQIASLSYGNVTGRVTSLVIDPADATGNTVYLGTTGGGVWKSTNAAGPANSVTFLPLTDNLPVYSANAGSSILPSLSIGALSVQPGTGLGAAILAGTGDPNDATDSYYGSGILRSVDGGNTWTLATGSNDGAAGQHRFLGLGTAGFAWSTSVPNLVVAAMSQSAEGTLVNAPDTVNSVLGLYYSVDAGQSWKMATIMDGSQTVQTPQPLGGNQGGNAATSVVWNPFRRLFFAAVRFHGVYQSSDGMTWTRAAHQPGTGLTSVACPTNPGSTGSSSCPLFRSALAVQPLSGDMYALTVDRSNLDQGLWQDVCSPSGSTCGSAVAFGMRMPSSVLDQSATNGTIAQGDYNLSLVAAPASAADTANTVLYAGTIDLYRCAFANANAGSCVLRNTTNALNGCNATSQVAPAQHALAALSLSQPLIYIGNDGGLWRSSDGVSQTGTACSPADATHFQNLNSSLGSLAESVSLAADPANPDILLLGVGANGTALTASASSLSPWVQLTAGEGGSVAIDQANPRNLYVSVGPGVSITYCGRGSACTAADFAGGPTIGPGGAGDAALIDAPFLLDPALSTDILLGTCRTYRGFAQDGSSILPANALSRPFGGPANAACSASSNPLVRSLAAGGPASGATAARNAGSTVLYAGLAGTLDGGLNLGGHVFTTAAAGTAGPATAWTDTAASGGFNPAGFDVSSIVADAHDGTGKTVYATIMGFGGNGLNVPHVYRSVDGGTTWMNISSNLPNAPANSVVVDPNDANTVYVALDTGVYVTTQVARCPASNCWSVLGTSLPNAPVIALVATAGLATGDGRTGELRAATYGRGVWQIPLLTAASAAQPAMTLTPMSLAFAPQAVATQSSSQAITVANTGNAPLTISSITASGDFTETDDCTGANAGVLPVGTTCTVQVSFLPTATGSRVGVLTVFGNVAGGQATATLSGIATQAAAIVLNPVAVTFPTTSIGATSAAINITVSNTGGTSASLQTPSIAGSDFQISANTCTGTLAAQTGCTVSVVFKPLVTGARTGTFTIVDSAGTQMASLSGNATSPATDALSPLTLSFGPQVLNTISASQTVILTNSGDVALTLIAAQIASGDFTVMNSCGNSLNGHSSCSLAVSYVPKSVGAENGILTVSDQFRTQSVALTGTGIAPAGVSLSPFAGITFPATAVGVISQPVTVTLTNNGGVALTIAGISVAGDFVILSNSSTCSTSLAPSSACTLQVAFAPTAGGSRSGSLVFSDSAGNSPQTLTLAGTAIDFTLTPNGATSITIANGASATFPFLLSSATGTTGTAAFTCLGAPAHATCNVTPQNPSLGAITPIAVTIATGAVVASQATTARTMVWLAGFVPLGCLLWRRRRSTGLRSGRLFAVLLPLCLAPLAFTMGCAIGRAIPEASAGSGTTGPVAVTPSGSYLIAVSATSAGLTRTVNVTLIVQ